MKHKQLNEAGRWALGAGHWALGVGRWVLGAGRWALHAGRWALGVGRWVLGAARWALHAEPDRPMRVKCTVCRVSEGGRGTHECSAESVEEGLSLSCGTFSSNTMVSVLARQNPLDLIISAEQHT